MLMEKFTLPFDYLLPPPLPHQHPHLSMTAQIRHFNGAKPLGEGSAPHVVAHRHRLTFVEWVFIKLPSLSLSLHLSLAAPTP